MARPFISVRCPACGSGDVISDGQTSYRCNHCGTAFVANPSQRPVVGARASGGGGGGRFVVLGVVGVVGITAVVGLLARSSDSPEPTAEVVAVTPEPPAPEPAPEPVIEPEPEPKPEPESERSRRRERAREREPEPESEPKPIVVAAYQPLKGCSCTVDFDGDGKADKVRLAVKPQAVGTWITGAGTSREFAFDFIVRPSKGEPIRLPIRKDTAPPKRRRGEILELGMACEGDRMLFAADSTASSFSMKSQAVEWTRDLPAPYVPKKAGRGGAGPAIICHRLPVKKGAVSVRLPGGTVALKTDDGQEPS